MVRIVAAILCIASASAIQTLPCGAQGLSQPPESVVTDAKAVAASGAKNSEASAVRADALLDGDESDAPIRFMKNIASDQKAIWASPMHLHWDDATWLFPLAGTTEALFATDRASAHTLQAPASTIHHYRDLSNYGLTSLVAADAAFYASGRIFHDPHKRETGSLAAEAMIDGLAVGSALQYSLGRQRPYQNGGHGDFFQGGTSFPSNHSVAAWSAASVFAHEYPGPLTEFLAYGMAAAVSASRVQGQQHFPSDVLVGGAIGWFIGREVYAKHHDAELGGRTAETLSDADEDTRNRHKMGSPSVPLDSWVYPAFDRLAGLGYINSSIVGLKPWTRIECARLTEEAGEALQQSEGPDHGAGELQDRLQGEFGREIALLDGGRNFNARLDSIYGRTVSTSGPALTDGYHFGQTVSYDFGRPFESGANGQAGGAITASAGPLTMYVRGEYQHSSSALALSDAAREAIAESDEISLDQVPSAPVAAIDRPRLLDAYVGVNLNNWQITIGKQSLGWAPGPGGSMLWSDNAEPINMVRMVNPEPIYLPGFLSHLGPVKIDQFWGRLGGQSYSPRPFIYGQKINLKLAPWFEVGFGRTVTIGGKGVGPENALTPENFIHSFVGVKKTGTGSVPGDAHSEMDWTFYVPKVRNYLVLYGDGYADDDPLPIGEPIRNPWRPGVYITHVPKIPKLDFHMEGVSTEYPGRFGGGNQGQFTYWNQNYRNGYTNDGFLIGDTVGREGRAIQFWFTYWQSSREILQFNYKHSTVSSDFIHGGGAWQDYKLHNETYLPCGFYLKGDLQYENISRFPVLFAGSQHNVTAAVELGFSPDYKK